MHNDVHVALRAALPEALRLLLPLFAENQEPWLRIQRVPNGWQSCYVNRPSIIPLAMACEAELATLGLPCIEALQQRHPQFLGLVGSAVTGQQVLFQGPAQFLRVLAFRYALRHGTSSVQVGQVEQIIGEFETFIDDPNLHLRCVIELTHFSMEAECIELSCGLCLRRLSDDEVSEIRGGLAWHVGNPIGMDSGISGYAVVTHLSLPKLFGADMGEAAQFAQMTANLDRLLLALRTFKAGQTGLSAIQIFPEGFTGARTGWGRLGDLPVPRFGSYQLAAAEVECFREHANFFFNPLDPALELACSRLSDAETRNRPQDRLLDAVIGLEAVLLVSVGEDDRRGELSNRFALNYSSLFTGSEERFAQYLVARDMYGHRSRIAHGGTIRGDNLKLGQERISLPEAANRACEMLRRVVKRFLPEGTSPSFRREALVGENVVRGYSDAVVAARR